MFRLFSLAVFCFALGHSIPVKSQKSILSVNSQVVGATCGTPCQGPSDCGGSCSYCDLLNGVCAQTPAGCNKPCSNDEDCSGSSTCSMCPAFVGQCSAPGWELQQFEKFAVEFEKEYNATEYKSRFEIFKRNLREIEELNKESETAVFGVNKFSDLSAAEFARTHKGYEPPSAATSGDLVTLSASNISKIDWTKASPKILTPIKNQGSCGSCWAFSATEQMETDWARRGNNLTEFSVQQVVTCDKWHGDLGCWGGNPNTGYEYVMRVGGIESDKEYPYKFNTIVLPWDKLCHFKKSEAIATINGWKQVKQDETVMQAYVASEGPLSVCVDAGPWQHYTKGVLKNCGTSIDHCVQIVGFDTTGPTPYWIVRNSWGENWGENGYIQVEMFKDTCGIKTQATFTN